MDNRLYENVAYTLRGELYSKRYRKAKKILIGATHATVTRAGVPRRNERGQKLGLHKRSALIAENAEVMLRAAMLTGGGIGVKKDPDSTLE